MRSRHRRKSSKKRRLHLESLEPRRLLTGTPLGELEQQSLKEAFRALGSTSNLEQSPLLNTTIPILDKKIGEVVDVDQSLREQFLTPVENFLDSPQPTVEGFISLLSDFDADTEEIVNTPTSQKFGASFDIDITGDYEFKYDLGAQLEFAGVEASLGTVMTELEFGLHFDAGIEIDLSKVDGSKSAAAFPFA